MTRPVSHVIAAVAAVFLTAVTFQQSIAIPAADAVIARAQLA